jgi:GT2 family glycosyltransferase
MSVVVYTPHDHRGLELLLRALRAQTVRERIELVVVCRSRETLAANAEDFSGLGRALIVETTDDHPYVGGKIAGVRAATTPIVAFAEDHCLPEPEWAERLIAAHKVDWAAVGPSMMNGNPRSVTSRVGFAFHFGTWAHPANAGEMSLLAAHNTSYKRSVLMGLFDELGELLIVEHFLHARIRERGHRLAIEPAAIASHCNISKLRPWWRICYHGGRLYGGRRVVHEQLSVTQRAFRVATSPLIPLLQLRRVAPHLRRTSDSLMAFASTLPLAALSLVVHTAGEVMGYLFGTGNPDVYEDLETSRFRDMLPSDVHALRARAIGSAHAHVLYQV